MAQCLNSYKFTQLFRAQGLGHGVMRYVYLIMPNIVALSIRPQQGRIDANT